MRELSIKEQAIIREKLIKGTTLPGMFSEYFLANGKFIIQIKESKSHRFEFYSDVIDPQDANEELVDVINLLTYLDKEGLITKYPPAATSLRDFETDQEISIGDSTSQKVATFLLIRQSEELVTFLIKNDNYFFQANEPLRVLAANNFRSIQERQFERTVNLTLRGQKISIGIALGTLILTVVINVITWKTNDAAARYAREETQMAAEQHREIQRMRDSLVNVQHKNELSRIANQLDSLRQSLKPKVKQKPKTQTK